MELLEKSLYAVPPVPRRTRTKTMKVLALGISRSGTESLALALRMLGYDHVFHGLELVEQNTWEPWVRLARRKWGIKADSAYQMGWSGITRDEFDVLLGHCEAVTDMPCAVFASELIKAYPEAKVILNHRAVDSWYKSAVNVYSPLMGGMLYHVLPWFNADVYWERQFVDDLVKPFYHGSVIRHGKSVYEEHCARVRGSVPADRLLEWTVEDGWEPLCEFLEKDIPSDDFPRGNTADITLGRFDNGMPKSVVAAQRSLVISTVSIGLVAAWGVSKTGWGIHAYKACIDMVQSVRQ